MGMLQDLLFQIIVRGKLDNESQLLRLVPFIQYMLNKLLSWDFFFFNIYFAAPGLGCSIQNLFCCGMWDLVPQSGIEPGPPALGPQNLTTGPPGKSLLSYFND